MVIEQMSEGVRLAFDPKLIDFFDIGSFGVECGLACTIDDFVIVGEVDGTNAGSEETSKEVVPRVEAPVGKRGIAYIRLDEVRHLFQCAGTEPTAFIRVEDVT